MTSDINFPNTFQVPNNFIDQYARLLTVDECVCLIAATREILGWKHGRLEKRARISLSRFQQLTPLSRGRVSRAIKGLCQYRLLSATAEANVEGQEYELTAVLDATVVNVSGLEARLQSRRADKRPQTDRARQAHESNARQRRSSLLDRPPAGMLDRPPAGMLDRPPAGMSNRLNKPIGETNVLNQRGGDPSPPVSPGGDGGGHHLVHGIDLRQSVPAILEALANYPYGVWLEVLRAETEQCPTRHSPRRTLIDAIEVRLPSLSSNGDRSDYTNKLTPDEHKLALALSQVVAEVAYNWRTPIAGDMRQRIMGDMKCCLLALRDTPPPPTVDELRLAYADYIENGKHPPRDGLKIAAMLNERWNGQWRPGHHETFISRLENSRFADIIEW